MKVPALAAALCVSCLVYGAEAGGTWHLDSTIPLGNVTGRLDHLAVNLQRGRLFVAEVANNTVSVIDLTSHQLLKRISGFSEPQGIAFSSADDLLIVANGGDGTVRFLHGSDFTELARLELGDDADNILLDDVAHRAYIGFGHAVAIVDTQTHQPIAAVPLKAHPEGIELDRRRMRLLINVPGAREIAVIDIDRRKQVAAWPTRELAANFPAASDLTHDELLSVFRAPATLSAFNMRAGGMITGVATCDDADNVFFDSRRARVYVICGAGFVDVFARRNGAYVREQRVPTMAGARTGLFAPETDQLFVACRATATHAAAVWIFHTVSP